MPVRKQVARWLLTGGAAAGPLFVGTFLAEGATREQYDPVRHPVSGLALGPGGRWQTVNFAVTGVLYLGLATGLALIRTDDAGPVPPSRLGPVLLGASAAGLIGSAIFVTDPISGYPPGTPDALAEPTATGRRHDLSAVPVFLGLPVAQVLYARAFRRAGQAGWAAGSAGSAAATFTGFALASAGFAQTPSLVRWAGLFQRASVISAFGWQTALALRAIAQAKAGTAMFTVSPSSVVST